MKRIGSFLVVLTLAGGLLVGVAPAAFAVTTTVTLVATPPTGQLGDTIDLDGTLAFGDATTAEGESVALTRQDWDGSVQPLGDAVVAADGTYHLEDTPASGGDLIYTATFAAHDGFDPATASDTVDLGRNASTVTAGVSKARVTFGEKVTITGHLAAATGDEELTITAQPVGSGDQVLLVDDVNDAGNLALQVTPNKTTTYVVSFAGDGAKEPSSDQTLTQVKVKLSARLVDFRSRQGKYKVYPRGGRAKCKIKVSPNHYGFSVNAYLQGFINGTWTTVDSGSAPLSPSSTQLVKAFGSSGIKARIRIEMVGHADHIGDRSPWLYFTFA